MLRGLFTGALLSCPDQEGQPHRVPVTVSIPKFTTSHPHSGGWRHTQKPMGAVTARAGGELEELKEMVEVVEGLKEVLAQKAILRMSVFPQPGASPGEEAVFGLPGLWHIAVHRAHHPFPSPRTHC